MSKYRADILTTQHFADYKFDSSDSGGDTMTWVDNRTFPVIKYDGNNYIFFCGFIQPDEQFGIFGGAHSYYEEGNISQYPKSVVRVTPTIIAKGDIVELSDNPIEVFPILFFRYVSNQPDLEYNVFAIEHISKIESYRQEPGFEGYFDNITEAPQLKSYPWFIMGTQKVQLQQEVYNKIRLDMLHAFEEFG